MIYRCENCGATFDRCTSYKERHGFSAGGVETFYVCPECGEPGLSWACQCDECGAILPKEELFDGLCIDCLRNDISESDGVEYIERERLAADFFETLLKNKTLTKSAKRHLEGSASFAVKTMLVYNKHEIINEMQKYIIRDGDDARVYLAWRKKEESKC